MVYSSPFRCSLQQRFLTAWLGAESEPSSVPQDSSQGWAGEMSMILEFIE